MNEQALRPSESGGNGSISDLGEHIRFGDREASEWASAAAPAAAAALPCLLSNNSDEHRVKLSGVDRKRAERTRRNIENFVAKHGTSTGVLTITFPDHLTTKEAQKRRENFTRRVLKENFGESMTIREFTQRGRPHFHLVIDCKEDISAGFNWEHHEAVLAWNKAGRKEAKPHGSLNRCPHLVKLHEILNAKGPLYHVGRMELTPVKKPGALGFYLAGYLSKSLAHKPADAKGTRAVNYSRHCPQILNGKWSWNNECGWLWRAKLRTWANKHGCDSMPEVAALFGPKWAYHHRQAIWETWLDFYPTAKHAQIDGCDCPPDAINIRRTRTGWNTVAAFRAWEARQSFPETLATLQRSIVGPPTPTADDIEVERFKMKYYRRWERLEEDTHGASRAPARVSPERPCAEQPSEIDTGTAGSGQAEEEWAAALEGRRLYVLKSRPANTFPAKWLKKSR